MYTPLNEISEARIDWNVKVRIIRAYHTTLREDPNAIFSLAEMYTPLNEISEARIDWNVKVRVIRAYHTTVREDPNAIVSLEYVFHDSQGGRLHATVNRANVK